MNIMNIEAAVSFLALLVSVLSAIYARRSVLQARHSNRIALHDRKLEVLDAFKKFRTALSALGHDFASADLFPLLAAPDKAKLYFKPSVVAELKRYSDASYELLISRDGAHRLQSVGREVPSEKWDEIFAKVDSCISLEKNLLEQLEAEVQVADV